MERKKNERPKRTKEEKRQEWIAFLEGLKKLPPERLSKAARWAIENEGKGPFVCYDLKAVLK